MSGRAPTTDIKKGRGAISVGNPETELPTGWRWTALSAVARLESGHTPSRKEPRYWGGAIPWVGIPDARANNAGIIYETEQTVTELGIENSAARILPAGTVCLSRTAASVGYTFVLGVPMATSQDFVNWSCSEALEPRFLMYALLNEGRDGLTSFGEGTVHPTIYYPVVKAFHIALPPVAEQRRIVALLDQLRSRSRLAMEAVLDCRSLLSHLRQSTLKDAFLGNLTASWRSRQARADRDSQLDREDELQSLPAGWTWRDFSHVAEIATQPVDPADHPSLPHIAPNHMESKTGRLLPFATVAEDAVKSLKHYFEPGMLIYSKIRPYLVKVVRVDFAGVCSADCYPIRARGVNPDYLFWYMLSPAFTAQATALQGGRTVLPKINKEELARIQVPIAPPPEQFEIVKLLESAGQQLLDLERIANSTESALLQFDRLILERAFCGALVAQNAQDIRIEDSIATSSQPPGPISMPKTTRQKVEALTLESMTAVAQTFDERFTFEELRRALPGSYEDFQRTLFRMLSQQDGPVTQVYDPKAGAVRLARRSQ